jgi:hypothetical protein
MQMYAQGPDGARTLVPYSDPRAEQMVHSQAFQEQLKKRIAIMQLQRLQRIQELGQTLSPDYRDQYAGKLTEAYLAGQMQRPQPTPQAPTEEQARSMINQYMSATGVDPSSAAATRTADKYDGTPPVKAKSRRKPKQNPVKIKGSKKSEKTSALTLSYVTQLEKVAGSQYPTTIGPDGLLTKNINGTSVSFDSSGNIKLAGLPNLGALRRYGKLGLGAAALGGLGYGGYKLHEYANRDQRSTGEKLYDAGKAALPSLVSSYKAYEAMKNQMAAANAPADVNVAAGVPMSPEQQQLAMQQQQQLAMQQQMSPEQFQRAQMAAAYGQDPSLSHSAYHPYAQQLPPGYQEIV